MSQAIATEYALWREEKRHSLVHPGHSQSTRKELVPFEVTTKPRYPVADNSRSRPPLGRT